MAKQTYSKAALHKETAQLKRYQQFVPSLELKRQQLIAESYKAAARVKQSEGQIQTLYRLVGEQLPMLADERIGLEDLVTVSNVHVGDENIVGVHVPVLIGVDVDIKAYSCYAKPHWVDSAVIVIKQMLELKLALKINQRRLQILQAAVKKVSQRVNFFDKILIPRAKQNIYKISIFLSDSERAGVIRAKIIKQKRAHKDF